MADRDIVTAFPLQLLTKMLETGNIIQQKTHMIHFQVTEHHSQVGNMRCSI